MKTQIGLPVQYFTTINGTKNTFAAVIVETRDYPKVTTDLRVFTKNNNPTSYLAQDIRHKDFKLNGEPYWDFLDLED